MFRPFVLAVAMLASGCTLGPFALADVTDAADSADATDTVIDDSLDASDARVCTVDAADPINPCSPIPRCGCSASQGCYLTTGGTYCSVAGAATEGQACAQSMSCAAGFECVGNGGFASCERFCETDDDCTGIGVGSVCQPNRLSSTYGTCTAGCDPTLETSCPTGSKCSLVTLTDGTQTAVCTRAGTGSQGTRCSSAYDCLPGFVCGSGLSGVLQCQHYCHLSDGSGCPTPLGCHAQSPRFLVGTVEYGACY